MSGLAITALRIGYFRSHIQTSLHFDGRPVAISGPNGAGKTNILEALSLLSPGRGLRRAAPEALGARGQDLGWKIRAEVRGIAAQSVIETFVPPQGGPRHVRIDDKAATQARLGETLRMLWLVPAMDRLWVDGTEARRRFLDRITLSFFPDHAEASLAYDKAMRARNRLLKDQVRDAHWYKALELSMAEAAARIEANRHAALAALTAAQSQEGAHFPHASLALTYVEGEGVDLHHRWPQLWAETRSRDFAAGRTLHGPHRADLSARYAAKDQPASECSTGEQKALLISVILANTRALITKTGRVPVILLDEVAAHLDAARRRALYDEILALGAQAFMTATEPSLFDSLGARAQNLCVREDGGVSRI